MIKSWKQFLKESKQLNLFQFTEWDTDEPELVYLDMYPVTPEDMEDYLLEIEESGYNIDIHFGFTSNNSQKFDQDITKYNEKGAIFIRIDRFGRNTNHEDVTSCLKTTINNLKRFYKGIYISDDGGEIQLDKLLIKNGIFIKTDDPEPDDLLSIDGSLYVTFYSDTELQLTDEMICKYYQFTDDLTYDEKGNVGLALSRGRLCDLVVSSKSSFRSVIEANDYEYDPDYDTSYYIPEHDSFFNYYLNNENIRTLLEYCFKNWDNLKMEYEDETIFKDYENLEDLINSVIKPKDRWKSKDRQTVGKFLDNTELGGNIYNELRRLYADMEISAKMDDDYEQIIEAFDKIVEDRLDTKILEKFRKNEVPYYRISFNLNWINYTDYESKYQKSIEDCIWDFDPEKTTIEPYFNDYASVDWKEFNIEAKHILDRRIKHLNNS
jgi:hypothetical protein